MNRSHLRLVLSNPAVSRSSDCRIWGLLNSVSRDLVLFELMLWAKLFHQVRLKLLARGDHVAICELLAVRPGYGRARLVMTELCTWADCARVIFELTPSGHWNADVDRLVQFYEGLGFEPNREGPTPFRPQESMIRYPVKGRAHVRL